jgi:hypothetical protein
VILADLAIILLYSCSQSVLFNWLSKLLILSNTIMLCQKNADIKFSAYVVLLAKSSSGKIKIKRMEIQRNKNTFWEEVGMSNRLIYNKGHRGRNRMVVGFTTTYAISAYHY